MQCWWFQ